MTGTVTRPRAYVEVRSQHSRGSSNGHFGGPDTYVAVQIVPPGVKRLYALQAKLAARRGITIKYFGEGYAAHTGPTSMLGQAIAKAHAFADEFNWTVRDQQEAS